MPARTHGRARTPLYRVWAEMRYRCANPDHPDYRHYGGRGIGVCERWADFSAFLEDMGERPKGLTLERIDNDGDYEPGNCRWATRAEQASNMRSNRIIEHNGMAMTLSQWARYLGRPLQTIAGRLNEKGWSVGRALH